MSHEQAIEELRKLAVSGDLKGFAEVCSNYQKQNAGTYFRVREAAPKTILNHHILAPDKQRSADFIQVLVTDDFWKQQLEKACTDFERLVLAVEHILRTAEARLKR